MKLLLLYILAFTGGVFLAVQSGFNTLLSSSIKHPVIAVVATSVTSAFLGCIFIISFHNNDLRMHIVQKVPWYLWFIGGIFSMAGISLYFYTIPRLGISRMITLGLFGQLIFSLIAGKFGWLNLPVEPVTNTRLIGLLITSIGIILMNSK